MSKPELEIRKWQDEFPGEPSEGYLRDQFVPATVFRVSKYVFPVGVTFPQAIRGGTVYVIAGCCEYDFGRPVRLMAGEFVHFPTGRYTVSVVGNVPAELVFVWNVEELWEVEERRDKVSPRSAER